MHWHGQVEQCAGLIVGLSSILQAGHLYWALAAPHEGALEPAVSEQWHEGSAPVCSFLSLLCLLRIYPSEGHFLEFLHHLSHSCEGQTFRLHFFGSQTTRPHVPEVQRWNRVNVCKPDCAIPAPNPPYLPTARSRVLALACKAQPDVAPDPSVVSACALHTQHRKYSHFQGLKDLWAF